MEIGDYSIQPILLFLPENKDRRVYIKTHLIESGIFGAIEVAGINADKFGMTASRPYTRDDPNSNAIQPQWQTGCTLSHYMLYSIIATHPDVEHWLVIEDDCLFVDGWQQKLEQALIDVPKDFDFLFIGSCCTEGREKNNVAGNIYEVKYPLCTHAYVVAKKAIPLLLDQCRDASQPIDVLLFDKVFPKSKVYTILPRIASQIEMELPV